MSVAARELAEKYVPWAKKLAKPWHRKFPCWRSDFEAAAMLGLCEAARTYDPSVGTRFATFASKRINGELATTYRDLADFDSRSRPLRTRSLMDRDPASSRSRQAEDLEDWLAHVPSKYARILKLVYLDGLSQKEVSRAVGQSQSRICALHREALAILAGRAV